MKRDYFTTCLLMGAGMGLLAMFISILPEGSYAHEPNKLILWGEIATAGFIVGWGLYSMVRMLKRMGR
jgi:hypothetical protein